MKKLEVIDLLNIFNGPWYIYETVKTPGEYVFDTVYVCGHRDTQRVKDRFLHRTVHDFTGCKGDGINIYLD